MADATDFDALRLEQVRHGEIETRRDVWLTAAVMTALLMPIGTLFGLAALGVAKGSRAAIDAKDWDTASKKIDLCRVLVLVGTLLSAVLFLYQAGALLAFFSAVPQIGQTR